MMITPDLFNTAMKRLAVAAAAAAILANGAIAEEATYGEIDLTGLARTSWPLNPLGESNAMVCNVNGTGGILSVRSAPIPDAGIARRLERLAIVVVDTSERRGNWVKVLSASRTHTIDGIRQTLEELPGTGWVEDDYLCDFLD